MIPKLYEIVYVPWLCSEGTQVVLQHPTRGLLLVPVSFIESTDNTEFSTTFSKAAYRVASSIEDKEWVHRGWLRQTWTFQDK